MKKVSRSTVKIVCIVLMVFGVFGAIVITGTGGRIFYAVVAGVGAVGFVLISRKDGTSSGDSSNNASVSTKTTIYKKWWFWLIVVIIIFAIIGALVGDDDANQSNEESQDQQGDILPNENPEDAENEPSPEEVKEQAESNDLIIYSTITQTQRYYDILNEALQGLDSGEANLLDVYSTCEDMQDYLLQFANHTDEVADAAAADYKEVAKLYIGNIRLIASDIISFIDTEDMEKLSSAQDGILLMPGYQDQVDSAREEYLSQAGFSDSEISEIVGSNETTPDNQESESVSNSTSNDPTEEPEQSPSQESEEPQEPDEPVAPSVTYVGSRDSDKYHRQSCRFADEILPENLITFSSKEEAEAAGYSPCGVCKP